VDPHNTVAEGINNNGNVVGRVGNRGFFEVTSANPPPPAGTTADIILHYGGRRLIRDLRPRQQC
jgi:hypothetical protein